MFDCPLFTAVLLELWDMSCMKRLLMVLAAFPAMLISQSLSAQVDFSYISDGDSLTKLTAIFGSPLNRFDHEWEDGETYATIEYSGCTATIGLSDNRLDCLIFWTSDIALFPSIVPGGIKVGDNVSKFKDIDFSKEVTGKHYEPAGLIPLRYQSKCNSSDAVYNYGILTHGEPFCVTFATEKGIIKEITVDHPVDAYNPDEEENTEARAISVTL